MTWLGIALVAWAGAFAAYRLSDAWKARAGADVLIAKSKEQAALHDRAKAEAEAKKANAHLEMSRNAREATKELREQLQGFRGFLPADTTAPTRLPTSPHLRVISDEPDPAA